MKKIIIFLWLLLPCLSLSAETWSTELLAFEDPSSTTTTRSKSKSKKSSKRTSKSTNRTTNSATSSKTQSQSQAGPEWLNGTWKCNSTVSTAFGNIRVNATVYINTRTRQIVAVDSGSTVSKGTYYVENDNIYAPSSLYIKIDTQNQRLEYGDGCYYTKVSDTSYLGN